MDGGAVWPSHYTAAQRHSQYMPLRKQIQSNSSHINFYRILSCTILILEDITDIAHGVFLIYFLNDIPLIPQPSARSLPFLKNPIKNWVVDWVTGDLSKSLGEIRGPNPFLGTSQREVLTHRGSSRGISMLVSKSISTAEGFYVMVCNVCNVCKKGRNTSYWVYWLLTWNAMKCLVSLCKTLVWITIDPFWSYLLV